MPDDPLHVAAATGNEQMAGMLLDSGVDIETPASNGPDGRFDPYGIGRVAYNMETALDTAVEDGPDTDGSLPARTRGEVLPGQHEANHHGLEGKSADQA